MRGKLKYTGATSSQRSFKTSSRLKLDSTSSGYRYHHNGVQLTNGDSSLLFDPAGSGKGTTYSSSSSQSISHSFIYHESNLRKVDLYCWLCHSFVAEDEDRQTCYRCPRIYHTGCLGLANRFPPDGLCPECCHISVDGSEEPLVTYERNLTELLCIMLLAVADQWELFERWPSHDKNSRLCVIRDLAYLKDRMFAKDRMYRSTAECLSEVKWIYHNANIVFGAKDNFTIQAKCLVEDIKGHLIDLEACPDCYIRFIRKEPGFFTHLCHEEHALVWAKIRGYSYWPAKVLKVIDGRAHVVFFGEHQRARVSVKKNGLLCQSAPCYALSESHPMGDKVPHGETYTIACEELKIYIQKLSALCGPYIYASPKTVFDPTAFRSRRLLSKRPIPANDAAGNSSKKPCNGSGRDSSSVSNGQPDVIDVLDADEAYDSADDDIILESIKRKCDSTKPHHLPPVSVARQSDADMQVSNGHTDSLSSVRISEVSSGASMPVMPEPNADGLTAATEISDSDSGVSIPPAHSNGDLLASDGSADDCDAVKVSNGWSGDELWRPSDYACDNVSSASCDVVLGVTEPPSASADAINNAASPPCHAGVVVFGAAQAAEKDADESAGSDSNPAASSSSDQSSTVNNDLYELSDPSVSSSHDIDISPSTLSPNILTKKVVGALRPVLQEMLSNVCEVPVAEKADSIEQNVKEMEEAKLSAEWEVAVMQSNLEDMLRQCQTSMQNRKNEAVELIETKWRKKYEAKEKAAKLELEQAEELNESLQQRVNELTSKLCELESLIASRAGQNNVSEDNGEAVDKDRGVEECEVSLPGVVETHDDVIKQCLDEVLNTMINGLESEEDSGIESMDTAERGLAMPGGRLQWADTNMRDVIVMDFSSLLESHVKKAIEDVDSAWQEKIKEMQDDVLFTEQQLQLLQVDLREQSTEWSSKLSKLKEELELKDRVLEKIMKELQVLNLNGFVENGKKPCIEDFVFQFTKAIELHEKQKKENTELRKKCANLDSQINQNIEAMEENRKALQRKAVEEKLYKEVRMTCDMIANQIQEEYERDLAVTVSKAMQKVEVVCKHNEQLQQRTRELESELIERDIAIENAKKEQAIQKIQNFNGAVKRNIKSAVEEEAANWKRKIEAIERTSRTSIDAALKQAEDVRSQWEILQEKNSELESRLKHLEQQLEMKDNDLREAEKKRDQELIEFSESIERKVIEESEIRQQEIIDQIHKDYKLKLDLANMEAHRIRDSFQKEKVNLEDSSLSLRQELNEKTETVIRLENLVSVENKLKEALEKEKRNCLVKVERDWQKRIDDVLSNYERALRELEDRKNALVELGNQKVSLENALLQMRQLLCEKDETIKEASSRELEFEKSLEEIKRVTLEEAKVSSEKKIAEIREEWERKFHELTKQAEEAQGNSQRRLRELADEAEKNRRTIEELQKESEGLRTEVQDRTAQLELKDKAIGEMQKFQEVLQVEKQVMGIKLEEAERQLALKEKAVEDAGNNVTPDEVHKKVQEALAQQQEEFEVKWAAEVDVIKRQFWCCVCLKPAGFYCCWNTGYCSGECQVVDWNNHMFRCTREEEKRCRKEAKKLAMKLAAEAEAKKKSGIEPKNGDLILPVLDPHVALEPISQLVLDSFLHETPSVRHSENESVMPPSIATRSEAYSLTDNVTGLPQVPDFISTESSSSSYTPTTPPKSPDSGIEPETNQLPGCSQSSSTEVKRQSRSKNKKRLCVTRKDSIKKCLRLSTLQQK